MSSVLACRRRRSGGARARLPQRGACRRRRCASAWAAGAAAVSRTAAAPRAPGLRGQSSGKGPHWRARGGRHSRGGLPISETRGRPPPVASCRRRPGRSCQSAARPTVACCQSSRHALWGGLCGGGAGRGGCQLGAGGAAPGGAAAAAGAWGGGGAHGCMWWAACAKRAARRAWGQRVRPVSARSACGPQGLWRPWAGPLGPARPAATPIVGPHGRRAAGVRASRPRGGARGGGRTVAEACLTQIRRRDAHLRWRAWARRRQLL
jgi:hypothetical protein